MNNKKHLNRKNKIKKSKHMLLSLGKAKSKALLQNKENPKWKRVIRILKKGLEIYNLGKDVASFLSLFVFSHLGVEPMIDNLIDDLTSFRIVFVHLALCFKKIKALLYLYQKQNLH